MDFSQLTPLPAPSIADLRPHTVEVAPGRAADVELMMGSFARSFDALDNSPAAPALVVTTSGSTGSPKQTVLTAGALAASARATETALGVQGSQWLLALPAHYVAGAQVLARSVLAGTSPVLTRSVSEGAPFTPADFMDATGRLTARHRLVSLVPTQLHKLLETPDDSLRAEVLDALRGFSAVLLGGAPASAALLTAAENAGIRVVTTYGSAETAGGCVYSGVPLPGVSVACQPSTVSGDSDASGRIWLGGPTLASGYLGDTERTAAHFYTDPDGNRWYRTDDTGRLDANGALTVLGRADDVIITGGIKVSGSAVAGVLESHPLVREALVFGVPDSRWGQVLTAAVTPVTGTAEFPAQLSADLTDLCRERLGVAATPKLVKVLEDFPALSTGKPDRRALQALLASAWARG